MTKRRSRNFNTMAGGVEENSSAESAQVFEHYRPLLYSIAYTILGSADAAQQMTNETLHLWLQKPDHSTQAARNFLVTTLATLCVDRLQCPNTPEPPPSITYPMAEMKDCALFDGSPASSIFLTFIVMLNRLTPTERIVFLLRTIFRYEYSQIAQALGMDEAECRKIAKRVKAYLTHNHFNFDQPLSLSQI
jgi:RNA polymerase sigma-70 factor (ECF subfamily)